MGVALSPLMVEIEMKYLLSHCLLIGFIAGPSWTLGAEVDPYRRQRLAMVKSQIAARGVHDKQVLAAMRQVPRHRMIPEKYRRDPYGDHPAGIGYGQTISQPYIVGYMTEQLELEKDARVLEVGTGAGYQAAVLAEIVKDVFTIEIVSALALPLMRSFFGVPRTRRRLTDSPGGHRRQGYGEPPVHDPRFLYPRGGLLEITAA